jgi:UDP-N-acetylmuramoyl-tripeptide--D-alanyl-D-alanine ligase
MMRLSEAATVLSGRLHGPDALFTSVNTDTRKLVAGTLFVALRGPHFDGHDFVKGAGEQGAAGALVARQVETALPQVQVSDTRLALGRLAAHWRSRFQIPLVAVTGSNGKTTVKNMIASILGQRGAGIATEGNLNNDIGMPLTLLRLRESDRYAVIEMGMNHRGEIDYLTRLARPTVAVVNNAAEAHLAGLGSVAAVARAKGEIFGGLTDEGVAVLNADDPHVGLWRVLSVPHRVLTFGLDHPADVTADYQLEDDGCRVALRTPDGRIDMRIPLLGKHNVMNALAASAASLAAGASLQDIQAGLEKLKRVSGRLEVKRGISGARVLDDTYNANPGSLAAGIEVLRSASGERVLVLGDMGELGEAAADLHKRVGELARQLGIHRLYAVGDLSRHTVQGFGQGARHFASQQEMIEALHDSMHGDMTLLVKGSRSSHMENVVAGIVAGQEA